VKTTALLTDMNQPLGRMAGNLVEVHEALATLEGRGPEDLWECTRELAAELLVLTSHADGRDAARAMLDAEIASGRPLAKFREMVTAQGGNLDQLPPISNSRKVIADRAGYVGSIDTEKLGIAIIELGGGRKVMTDSIDHSVGLEMLLRIGDRVEAGQPIVRTFGGESRLDTVRTAISAAIELADQPPRVLPLIVEHVT
jgi:thymidine phosphorylase